MRKAMSSPSSTRSATRSLSVRSTDRLCAKPSRQMAGASSAAFQKSLYWSRTTRRASSRRRGRVRLRNWTAILHHHGRPRLRASVDACLEILSRGAFAFMSAPDVEAVQAMPIRADGRTGAPPIVAGRPVPSALPAFYLQQEPVNSKASPDHSLKPDHGDRHKSEILIPSFIVVSSTCETTRYSLFATTSMLAPVALRNAYRLRRCHLSASQRRPNRKSAFWHPAKFC